VALVERVWRSCIEAEHAARAPVRFDAHRKRASQRALLADCGIEIQPCIRIQNGLARRRDPAAEPLAQRNRLHWISRRRRIGRVDRNERIVGNVVGVEHECRGRKLLAQVSPEQLAERGWEVRDTAAGAELLTISRAIIRIQNSVTVW